MPPVADLPKDLKRVGCQALEHINRHTIVSCCLTSVASCQIIRNLILLGVIIISLLEVGLDSPSLTSMLLTNSNSNMSLVLKCNPPTHIIINLFDHNF